MEVGEGTASWPTFSYEEDNLVSNSTEGKTVQIQLMIFTFKDFIFHLLLRSIQCNEHFYSRYFISRLFLIWMKHYAHQLNRFIYLIDV